MIPISPKLLGSGINGYSDVGAQRKKSMHLAGMRFMRLLAQELGMQQGSFDVRSNKGGVAVSGEVTLHGEYLYVQMSESPVGDKGACLMYRRCKGRGDFTGGPNGFISMELLRHPQKQASFLSHCKALMGPKHASEMEAVEIAKSVPAPCISAGHISAGGDAVADATATANRHRM